MKKILCYGDSNTFGYVPKKGERYTKEERWTGILQTLLMGTFEIIEEGMCDRTGFVPHSGEFIFSSQEHFPNLLSKYNYIDIIILAIGTNDLQFQYNVSRNTIEKGLETLIQEAKNKTKNIILIPPVVLFDNILNGYFKIQFDKTSIEKSKTAGDIYKKLAEKHNCKIFDINEFAKPSEEDGLHYDKASHKLIAEKLFEFIEINDLI